MVHILNVARLPCCKNVCQHKKFDLVHQTIFPCVKVGSGDETIVLPSIQIVVDRATCNLGLGYRVVV